MNLPETTRTGTPEAKSTRKAGYEASYSTLIEFYSLLALVEAKTLKEEEDDLIISIRSLIGNIEA